MQYYTALRIYHVRRALAANDNLGFRGHLRPVRLITPRTFFIIPREVIHVKADHFVADFLHEISAPSSEFDCFKPRMLEATGYGPATL
jgi:hypothetical protein